MGSPSPPSPISTGKVFSLPKSRKIMSALELDGSKVCVQSGTTTEDNLVDFFKANGMSVEHVTVPNASEALKAYANGPAMSYRAMSRSSTAND